MRFSSSSLRCESSRNVLDFCKSAWQRLPKDVGLVFFQMWCVGIDRDSTVSTPRTLKHTPPAPVQVPVLLTCTHVPPQLRSLRLREFRFSAPEPREVPKQRARVVYLRTANPSVPFKYGRELEPLLHIRPGIGAVRETGLGWPHAQYEGLGQKSLRSPPPPRAQILPTGTPRGQSPPKP